VHLKKNKVIIIGAFSEIFELCDLCGLDVVGYIDDKQYNGARGIRWLGRDSDAEMIINKNPQAQFVITPDMPSIRRRIYLQYKEIGASFITVISPYAYVSKSAETGNGSIIQSGAYLSSNVNLGDFVKVNVKANIMHDSNIGDFTTIAPNAVVLGRVSVGRRCYIGANSTIKQQVKICDDSTIGVGAAVVKDVLEAGVYIGVPAQRTTMDK
jgi:sugar O-acyltransferase (sialic acid O-acetyltransferase NeuD family)